MTARTDPPLIYNLFPRLAGPLDRWAAFAEKAADMGFNCLYVNPIHYPGFSGSLYAIKDYRRLCPDLLPEGFGGDELALLREVLGKIRAAGLKPIIDLVINHTAIDSPLTKSHPQWYRHDKSGKIVHPSAIDPADARKVTVWGDLAEIDNEHSKDKKGLWQFWRELLHFYQELGFVGFRCDAAYMVPAKLWTELIAQARRQDPEAFFIAETLGCRIEQVTALKSAGFDYLFNSSKYWNFDSPWALEQHEEFGAIAPSISFPESHDTPRLAAQPGVTPEVLRQRYLFAAFFSEGLLMPMGYEFGFKKPLHVVESHPADWEQPSVDLSAFIRAVNRLKRTAAVWQVEGNWRALVPFDRSTLTLEKTGEGDRLIALINKDWHHAQTLSLEGLEGLTGQKAYRIYPDGTLVPETLEASLNLDAAEIALVF